MQQKKFVHAFKASRVACMIIIVIRVTVETGRNFEKFSLTRINAFGINYTDRSLLILKMYFFALVRAAHVPVLGAVPLRNKNFSVAGAGATNFLGL